MKLLPAVRVLGSPGVDPALLDWAIRHGDSRMVAVLLPASTPAVDPKGGEAPVLAAVRTQQAEVLAQLLEGGQAAGAVDQGPMTHVRSSIAQ